MRSKLKSSTRLFSFITIFSWIIAMRFADSEAIKPINVSPPNFRHIGCYDSWENSTGHYFGSFYNSGNISIDFCRRACHLIDVERRGDFVVLIKERFCACAYWEHLVNARVDDKHCTIQCEEGHGDRRSCGGNYGLSAYCDEAYDSCTTFEPPPIEDVYKSEPLSTIVLAETKPEIIYACANCSICYGTYYPRFDYIPRNTPEACIEFCRRRINYWANGFKIRNPTPLAAVGWSRGKAPKMSIPSCACLDSNSSLEALNAGECDQTCPGDDGQICGGLNKFLFSVYQTGILTESNK